MKYTQQQRLIAGLKAMGEQDVTHIDGRHRKGHVFTRTRVIHSGKPEPRPRLRYWIGENGSIRLGKSRRVSAPLNDDARGVLMDMGTKALEADK